MVNIWVAPHYRLLICQISLQFEQKWLSNRHQNVFNMATIAVILKLGIEHLRRIKVTSLVGTRMWSFTFISSGISEENIFKVNGNAVWVISKGSHIKVQLLTKYIPNCITFCVINRIYISIFEIQLVDMWSFNFISVLGSSVNVCIYDPDGAARRWSHYTMEAITQLKWDNSAKHVIT